MTAGPSDAETCLHVSISEANSHALRNDRLKMTVAATLAFCGSLSRILFPDSESGAIRVVIAQIKSLKLNHQPQITDCYWILPPFGRLDDPKR